MDFQNFLDLFYFYYLKSDNVKQCLQLVVSVLAKKASRSVCGTINEISKSCYLFASDADRTPLHIYHLNRKCIVCTQEG